MYTIYISNNNSVSLKKPNTTPFKEFQINSIEKQSFILKFFKSMIFEKNVLNILKNDIIYLINKTSFEQDNTENDTVFYCWVYMFDKLFPCDVAYSNKNNIDFLKIQQVIKKSSGCYIYTRKLYQDYIVPYTDITINDVF
jgi:hypothetical protein